MNAEAEAATEAAAGATEMELLFGVTRSRGAVAVSIGRGRSVGRLVLS